ncbi:PIN domain-like protein [Cantharellus anzutake]|uniref:PIN domain-like protein n=1 Tax=Cantharellus anzutake TaxID=1750568 RepID=UPI0019088AFE|nr:PIN domain-like protein [Cantharellus anzutake]KAF8340685.1 PIN domain-like protein [Cantharellus anzutake]
MGIHGLAPFLQKTCPDVIRELPNRLRALAGKTIAVDGTLVTQRLHFSNIPYEFKHILGWHRLLMELRDNNVGVICVFDGKERSEAKQAETERRRAARSLVLARSTMELQRSRRLRQMSDLLRYHASRSPGNQTCYTPEFIKNTLVPFHAVSVASEEINVKKREEVQLGQLLSVSLPKFAANRSAVALNDDSSLNGRADRIPLSLFSLHGYQKSHSEPNQENQPTLSPAQTPPPDPQGIPLPQASTDDNVAAPTSPSGLLPILSRATPADRGSFSDLEEYYRAYRRSVPLFTVPPKEPATGNASTPRTMQMEDPLSVDDERASQYAISRSQHEMTLQEGLIWDSFFQTQDLRSSAEQFEILAGKSQALYKSYEHRGTPPTDNTYVECKLIIEAMGVPVIDCPRPFEAEALASSLVLNGHADYVASEDTDVLVYQAPLIRNLTNRNENLTLISGAEVRERLDLPLQSYIDFALLLGTDFSQRLRGLGPHRAIELIRAHGSIEQILDAQTRLTPPNKSLCTPRRTRTTRPVSKRVYSPEPRASREEYLLEVQKARKIFETLPPLPENLRFSLNAERKYDHTQVAEILAEYGLPRWLPEDEAVMLDLDVDYFSNANATVGMQQFQEARP